MAGMKRLLPEICEIQMGFTLRRPGDYLRPARIIRVDDESGPAPQPGPPFIQMRDVPDSLVMPMEGFQGAPEPESAEPQSAGPAPGLARYLVRGGDVLFRSRGDRASAAVVDPDFTGALPAALPLVILRPRPACVTGAYLAWALNQAGAQRHFARAAQGGNMRMIPRAALDTLEINAPSLPVQRCVTAADLLSAEEERLAVRLAAARRLRTRLTLESAAERAAAL